MNLLDLPIEVFYHICKFIPLPSCLSLKLACRELDNILESFSDVFEARFIYSIVHRAKTTKGRLSKLRGRKSKSKNLTIEHINSWLFKLEKGRNFIIKNNPGWYRNFLLKWCCRNGFDKIVNILINDERVDLNIGGPTALTASIKYGHYKIAKYLIETEKVYSQASLEMLIAMRWTKLVVYILEKSPEISSYKLMDILKCAIHSNNIDIVKLLLADDRFDRIFRNIDDALLYEMLEIGTIDILSLLMKDRRVHFDIDWDLFYESILDSNDGPLLLDQLFLRGAITPQWRENMVIFTDDIDYCKILLKWNIIDPHTLFEKVDDEDTVDWLLEENMLDTEVSDLITAERAIVEKDAALIKELADNGNMVAQEFIEYFKDVDTLAQFFVNWRVRRIMELNNESDDEDESDEDDEEESDEEDS